MNSLILLATLATLLVASTGVAGANDSSNGNGVLRVKTHHIELSKEQAELLNKHPRRQARLERIRAQMDDMSDGQSSPIPLTPIGDWILAGNLSIGTPPQQLQVSFDFNEQDLFVFDTAAASSSEKVANRYDSSASSTYTADSRNFSEWYYYGKAKGLLASDLVNLGGLEVNLTFGDATQFPNSANSLPIGGFFGLSLERSSNNISNVLTQLISGLDKPLVAMYSNKSSHYNGSGEIVFGTDQLDSCVNNWQYTPYTFINSYGALGFHLSGVSIDSTDSCKASITKVNYTLELAPYNTIYIGTSYQLQELFVRASGANYNNSYQDYGAYVIPCDGNSGNVTFTLGDGTSKLVLTAADYSVYNKEADRCELLVVGYYDENNPYYNGQVINLGMQFLQNHCFAYNLRDQLIGFSDAIGHRQISEFDE